MVYRIVGGLALLVLGISFIVGGIPPLVTGTLLIIGGVALLAGL